MPHRSPAAIVLDRAQSQPGAIAFVQQGREVSYGELACDIEATAGDLAARGVVAGDRIVLEPDASPQAGYALVRGLYALNYLGAAALILSPGRPAANRSARMAATGARRLDWGTVVAEVPAVRADHPGGPTYFRFTTGSTGEPKAVLLSNAQLCEGYAAAVQALRLGPEERFVPAIPLPHPIAVRGMLRIHAAGGALVDEHMPAAPRELAALMSRLGVTSLHLSPAQVRTLLAAPDCMLPPPARLLVAGAPLTPEEQDAVRKRLSPNLFGDYAATEMMSMAVRLPEDEADSGWRLVDGVEAEVLDANGAALPPGQVGELRVRAPWTPAGYVAGGEGGGLRGGWFHPGDLAKLVAPGRLVLMGRADELINRSGIKIQPSQIETVLAAHPQVRDVAVVGIPDRVAGELPVAFVVLSSPDVLPSLQAYCRERIEEHRLPAAVVRVAEIPRSAEGKVLRASLRKLVRAG